MPWRECVADVVAIRQDADGGVCQEDLRERLEEFADRPLVIGSFSAASNVTGIVSDTHGISAMLHAHGALAFWDFAAAAPYVDIEMNAPAGGDPLSYKDAIFLSPHKFIGGPSTPGVLVARRELFTNRVPVVPGGGTVAYVNPEDHAYLTDPAHREEGGTPAIIESVRAGLVFQLKEAVGVETIRTREEHFLSRAVESWRAEPGIEILGNLDAPRLSIVSFVVRAPSGQYLHHNFVVAVLNDLFGVQARGGCSCAGPYGHRLLGIDIERSHEFEREITGGCEGIKPGWVRVNFNYFLSDTVADYVVEAVRLVARDGWRLLGDYLFDPLTGRWRHRDGVVEPPIRLGAVRYTDDGEMVAPRGLERAGEDVLAEQLHRRGAHPGRRDAARPQHPGRPHRRLRAPALVRPPGERPHLLTLVGAASEDGMPEGRLTCADAASGMAGGAVRCAKARSDRSPPPSEPWSPRAPTSPASRPGPRDRSHPVPPRRRPCGRRAGSRVRRLLVHGHVRRRRCPGHLRGAGRRRVHRGHRRGRVGWARARGPDRRPSGARRWRRRLGDGQRARHARRHARRRGRGEGG